MPGRCILWLSLWLLVLCGAACDRRLEPRPVETPPVALPRVVSLAPNLTQAIFSLGAEAQLVGRSDYCTYPAAALAVPSVGRLDLPSYEAILELQPDWVLVSGLTPIAVVERLRNLGFRVQRFTASGIEGIISVLDILGEQLERVAAAEHCIAEIEATVAAYSQRTSLVPFEQRPKVALLYSLDALYSAGAGTFPDDLIRIAGGRNIAAEAVSAWPQLNMEALLSANPQVLCLTYDGSQAEATQLRARLAALQKDPIWGQLSAIQNNRVQLLLGDYLSIPSARSLEVLESLSAALAPR